MSERERTPRWVIGLIIAGAVVLMANALFIYIAVTGADPVVSSYKTEHR